MSKAEPMETEKEFLYDWIQENGFEGVHGFEIEDVWKILSDFKNHTFMSMQDNDLPKGRITSGEVRSGICYGDLSESEELDLIKRYARLMIEADRERVADNAEIIQCDTEYNSVTGQRDPVYCIDKESILNLPIELT